MDVTLLGVVGLVVLAAVFDYTNGFHDSANSIATVVATGVLAPRLAVLWAAGWNFVAFLVFGTAVANTVAQTVNRSAIGLGLIFAALVGALVWNFGSWHLGLPTSSSHALVGGLVGAGVAKAGWSAISSRNLAKVGAFIVVSPVLGLLMGALGMGVLRLVVGRRGRGGIERSERTFRRAQLLSSAAVSLGHGGNDAQKTMGVVAAVLIATGHLQSAGGKVAIPLWVVLLAHSSIALGTFAGGWRIVRTMGMRITRLRPVSGFAAETGAAVAIMTSTFVGAPVSTTHTVAGAISGVGATNRGADVDWSVFGRVAVAWVATMPVAAVVAAGVYRVTIGLPPGGAVAAMTVVLTAVAGFVGWSMRQAPRAADFEPAGDEAASEYPVRAGSGSLIPPDPTRSDTELDQRDGHRRRSLAL